MPESEYSQSQQRLEAHKETNRQLEEMNKTLAVIAENLKGSVAVVEALHSVAAAIAFVSRR